MHRKKAFVYPVQPRSAEPQIAAQFLATLTIKPGNFLTSTGGLSGFGATPLDNGDVLFGLYHPNAAQVFLMGTFNDWQRPSHDDRTQPNSSN